MYGYKHYRPSDWIGIILTITVCLALLHKWGVI